MYLWLLITAWTGLDYCNISGDFFTLSADCVNNVCQGLIDSFQRYSLVSLELKSNVGKQKAKLRQGNREIWSDSGKLVQPAAPEFLHAV